MGAITKTLIPTPRKGLVRRQRLLDVLYQSLDHKLVLVTAAAGFGKTTLLVDFARDATLPICWLTLDQEDSDPAQFLSSLVSSIAQCFEGFGQLTRAAMMGGAPVGELATVLVNELVSQVQDFFVIILDDYHLADTPAVGTLVQRLLRIFPANVRLILSGRTLPALNLVRLAARQEVTALVPQELCFTTHETTALLEVNHGLPVQMEAAEALTQKMQGWVTGIILATQSITQRLTLQPQQIQGTLDAIYAYLAEEVLTLQPLHVRDFLLQTAVLRWMTANICSASTGG